MNMLVVGCTIVFLSLAIQWLDLVFSCAVQYFCMYLAVSHLLEHPHKSCVTLSCSCRLML